MKRLALLALTFLLALCSCATSEQRLYMKFASTANYHQATYEHRCKNTGGHFPPECAPCEAVIAKAAWQAQTAKTNVAIGYMDPKEIAEIQQTMLELQACP